ncbi:MAG: hypothetical protein HC915_03885 [Anaerolineae bacterium]|nr:hypothetical protein [Anaerolineae bacterium]
MVHDARFSQHARRALLHARTTAQRHAHPLVDTDHLLLGIWLTEGSFGWRVLRDLAPEPVDVEQVLQGLHPRQTSPLPSLPYSEGVEASLALARDEAYWLGHHYLGTEHLLLGLVRSGAGQGVELMRNLEISALQIRRRVQRLLSEGVTEINLEAARRMTRLSELSRRVLNAATRLAHTYRHPAPLVEHLLLVLARERRSLATRWLLEAGLAEARLAQDLERMDFIPIDTTLDDLLERAVDRAEALGTHYTGTDHILLAMTLDEQTRSLLERYAVDILTLQQRLNQSLS